MWFWLALLMLILGHTGLAVLFFVFWLFSGASKR